MNSYNKKLIYKLLLLLIKNNNKYCYKNQILLMLIYLILAYKVIKKIGEEKDNKIKLILLGSISLILLQTFVHIGVNIRILPTTGMTLPFLSYGGSSIVGVSILSGIILNLTKRKIY